VPPGPAKKPTLLSRTLRGSPSIPVRPQTGPAGQSAPTWIGHSLHTGRRISKYNYYDFGNHSATLTSPANTTVVTVPSLKDTIHVVTAGVDYHF
jgi:hypothetical protein